MLQWSVDAVAAAGCAPIIVVAPAAHLGTARGLVGAVAEVVPGGSSRQESVRLGLERVDADRVVVHDAARPLATPGLVSAVVAALGDADAAVAAVPLEDTLKQVRSGVVVRTLDRAGLWRVQTPQAFATAALRTAHERAAASGMQATDDAQLVELAGGRVVVVPGERDNLKLTYPEDLGLAEALLGARR